jgi:RNA polymerase sigma factor (sigma-70 family)
VDLNGASDEDLMLAVCAEDAAAFEELVRRFQPRLFHFTVRRVNERQAAEDVVQETLLKVWRHRESFRHGSRLSTWVFALCLNLIRDHWRRAKPESSMERPEVALAAELSGLRRRAADPSDEAYRHELAELLLEALEQVPAQSAELLSQRSRHDLTLEEAGQRVGLGPDAARAAASRAYKKLKAFLSKRMDQP